MTDFNANVYLINRGFKALIASAYEPIRDRTGLTQMECQIIFTLSKFPCSTVGGIYKNSNFNKGQISISVANIIKHDFARIVKKEGCRFDCYELTEKGVELAKEIDENVKNGRKHFLKGFTAEEVKDLQAYLDRILNNIGDFEKAIEHYKKEIQR